ncbi:MAG: ABC transporter substrate-binding protein [Candidatus Shapirobacteria bacterium]
MIKKLRFTLELYLNYLKRNLVLLLGGFLVGSVFFIGRNQLITFYQNQFKSNRIIGVEGLSTSQNLPSNILEKISYGLFINQENDRPDLSPLVKSFDIQNNNLDYIIELNDNIYWHSGKKFTADDIFYNIAGIKIEPISDTSLKISLNKPFTPILSALTKPLIQKNLVGLGEYLVKQVTHSEGFVKQITIIPTDKANRTSITYKFYPDAEGVINAYKLGEIDEAATGLLPPEMTSWANTKITQKIHSDKKYAAVFINTAKYDSKSTRQALSYATPKTTDRNERCFGPIPPNSWAYNPSVKEYTYNPARAKELIGDTKIEQLNLSVTDRTLLPIAEKISSSWEQNLGIKTTITVENQIDNQNYDAILAYSGIPSDPDQYTFWHSTQTETNITHLNNSRIDKLLEEGRTQTDITERKKTYLDFQQFLSEESPAIFLFYPTSFTFSRIK